MRMTGVTSLTGGFAKNGLFPNAKTYIENSERAYSPSTLATLRIHNSHSALTSNTQATNLLGECTGTTPHRVLRHYHKKITTYNSKQSKILAIKNQTMQGDAHIATPRPTPYSTANRRSTIVLRHTCLTKVQIHVFYLLRYSVLINVPNAKLPHTMHLASRRNLNCAMDPIQFQRQVSLLAHRKNRSHRGVKNIGLCFQPTAI